MADVILTGTQGPGAAESIEHCQRSLQSLGGWGGEKRTECESLQQNNHSGFYGTGRTDLTPDQTLGSFQ